MNTATYLNRRSISKFANAIQDKFVLDSFDDNLPLYNRNLYAHFGCINAIEFSLDGRFLVSGGDDRRVLLWNVNKTLYEDEKPIEMRSEHLSNIFCLSFADQVPYIYSAGNDDQVLVHDIESKRLICLYNLESPIYGLSVNPDNGFLFTISSDNGLLLLNDTRISDTDSGHIIGASRFPFHSVMYNPTNSNFIVSSNAKDGIGVWDVRKGKKPLLQLGEDGDVMCARWANDGNRVAAIGRKRMPELYDIARGTRRVARFEHAAYRNSCTMKTCSFMGPHDEFVVTGSDDNNVYMWKVRDALEMHDKIGPIHTVLQGHRSIVNHSRYSPNGPFLATSGVEKIIKIWSPFHFPNSKRGTDQLRTRRYTQQEYEAFLYSPGPANLLPHDYSEGSMEEDSQMLAFFDSLVMREEAEDAATTDNTPASSDDEPVLHQIRPLSDSDSEYSSTEEPISRHEMGPNYLVLTSGDELVVDSDSTSGMDSEDSVIRPYESDSQNSDDSDELFVVGEKRKLDLPPPTLAIQRLKRARRSVSPSSNDETNQEGLPWTERAGCSSASEDSGVFDRSSSPVRFALFRRNEKRKYRRPTNLDSSDSE